METITLTPEQQEAVNTLPLTKYGLLVGSAGTGKTTCANEVIQQKLQVIQHLCEKNNKPFWQSLSDRMDLSKNTQVDEYHSKGDYLTSIGYNPDLLDSFGHPMVLPVAFCAFTARAATRIQSLLPEEFGPLCTTIHKLLRVYMARDVLKEKKEVRDGVEYTMQETGAEFVPTFDRTRKLPLKLLVVDEASMLSTDMWDKLLDALDPECHILLIGDIQQLPPVGSRSILPHCMSEWGFSALTKVMRTKEMSIVNASQSILKGEFPQQGENFKVLNLGKVIKGGVSELAAASYIVKVVEKLVSENKFKHEEDIILVSRRKASVPISVDWINEKLLPVLNPGERTEVKCGEITFKLRVGDRVAFTSNNYVAGYINGSLGTIRQIEMNPAYEEAVDLSEEALQNLFDENTNSEPAEKPASHYITVQLDGGEIIVCKTYTHYSDLSLGYVNTIHASQGCEYRNVFVVCTKHDFAINREALYTAVTRAKNKCVLICDSVGVLNSLKRQAIKGTTIEEKLASAKFKESTDRMKDKKYKPVILPTNERYNYETITTSTEGSG